MMGPSSQLNCKIRDLDHILQTLEQYFSEDIKGKVISNECCDWCTKHVSNGWPNFSIKRERHISKLIYLLISFRGNKIYRTINLLCSAIQWWQDRYNHISMDTVIFQGFFSEKDLAVKIWDFSRWQMFNLHNIGLSHPWLTSQSNNSQHQ